MSFLTIAGPTYSILSDGSAAQQPSEYAGSLRRAFDMTMRNTTRARKRVWAFTIFASPAELATLESATSLRQSVLCGGDALGGGVYCSVIAQVIPFVRDGDASNAFKHTISVTLMET